VFKKLLESPNINIELDCDYFKHSDEFKIRKKTIYSGPIDRFYGYKHGKLEWRSVSLEKQVVAVDDYQGTAVMNYADLETNFTRIHEPKHLHPERQYDSHKSVIFIETANLNPEEPYYPVETERNHQIFQKYKALSERESNVIIGGRLGNYAYHDMDKTILEALECYHKRIKADLP
jgi:UDP-galactopyranose mutase